MVYICQIALVISLSLILQLYEAHYISWTKGHQECFQKVSYRVSNSTALTTAIHCEDSHYITYVHQHIKSPQSEFHKIAYELINNLYVDLEHSLEPAVVNIDKPVLVYPISFCIPEENILKTTPPKTKAFGRVIPGNYSTYYHVLNESDYFKDMQNSLFAITHKKGGWDCLRHLEILAAGSLPLFVDISNTPHSSLALHPKRLYAHLLHYPGLRVEGTTVSKMSKQFNVLDFDMSHFHSELYLTISSALLQYSRNVLSSKAMAEYMYGTMVTASNDSIPVVPKKIFYLTHQDHDMDKGDYMTDFLLHGLKTLFGAAVVVDFPCRDALYKTPNEFNRTDYYHRREKLYGAGFSWGLKIDMLATTKERDHSVITENIVNRRYDAVILGSGHRDGWASKLHFWDLVCKHYSPSEVGFVDGADYHLHKKLLRKYAKCAGHIFSREGYVGE